MPTLKISSCTILLLDGSEFIVEADKLQNSWELLREVYNNIGVNENWYFGLQYEHPDDQKISWFDVKKPLHRQLKKASNKFKVGVQFYPTSLQMLEDEFTRYQFVLQIRENLLTGIWSCAAPTQALLASYVVQAELGDYNEEEHGSKYLNGFQFAPGQDDEFLEKVHLFHRKHVGFSPADAEWMYLETARKMVSYGMEVFNIMDADENPIILGVNANGVHVLHLNTMLHSLYWPAIIKVHRHGQELLFDVISHRQDGQTEGMVVSFVCPSIVDQKRIQKLCMLYKEFVSSGNTMATLTTATSRGKWTMFRKKRENCNTETPKCLHVANNGAPNDFKRIDSARFSKRLIHGGNKEETVLNGKEQVENQDPGPDLNDKVHKEGEDVKHIPIPVITETLASDEETHPADDSTTPVTIQKTEDKVASDNKEECDAEVLVKSEDVTSNQDVEEEEKFDIVPEDTPSCPSDKIGTTETDGSPYDVECDTDVVIIEYNDVLEICQDGTEKEISGSLMEEIQKELRASHEKV